MNDTSPTVTDTRTALLRETSEFYRRRQPHHHAIRTLPETDPTAQASFDAYEGLVAAGCFAETLATVLRIVEQRHPETANDLASLIRDVQENGNDCLDGANDDIWAVIEAETAAKSATACTAEVSDHTCTCLAGEPAA